MAGHSWAYSIAKELFCGGQIRSQRVDHLVGYVECQDTPSICVQDQSYPAVFLRDRAAAKKLKNPEIRLGHRVDPQLFPYQRLIMLCRRLNGA